MDGLFYDVANGLAEKRLLAQLRESSLADCAGEIVDVGAGTGRTFAIFV
jgi:hypothetical protein